MSISVYPIEISSDLQELVENNQLDLALSYEENTAEACWIKALALLEASEKSNAERLFNKVLKLAKSKDNLINRFHLSAQVELVFIQPIRYFKDRELTKQLTQQIKQQPQDRLLARLYHALAILMQWRRNTPQAIQYLLHSRDIYQSLSEDSGLARILDTLGNVSGAIADHEQALLFYSESLALKTLLNDIQGQAITLGNLSRLCLQLGRYRQARSFAELDVALCENENSDTKARLLNLIARIDMAEEHWDKADKHLNMAITLLDKQKTDSLFFCIKDQALLSLKQNRLEGVKAKLNRLAKLLPANSPYHQSQLQIVKNLFIQQDKGISLNDAESLLDVLETLELPELEIDYRMWLSLLAEQSSQPTAARQQLLLARKISRKTGFKRFLPQINSKMLELNITENITEETIRVISDSVTNVDDGYLIRKKLGGGGFGDVFLAHDMINDRDVAIKRFHTGDLTDHRQQNKRWNQARLEFEAVSAISHPSIAKIYAIGHDSTGSPYLVQEFISGGDLTQVMNRSNDTQSNLTNALSYLIPITRALAAIHEVGIIHRDIKPENILINRQGITVLVDFGIALLKQGKARIESIQGTEHYIAPEQKLSSDIDHKADLFSLGCVLYEWLSGEKIEVIQSKTNNLTSWLGIKKTAEITEIDQKICGKAYQLITSLLALKPEDRPENASLVADQMQQILDG